MNDIFAQSICFPLNKCQDLYEYPIHKKSHQFKTLKVHTEACAAEENGRQVFTLAIKLKPGDPAKLHEATLSEQNRIFRCASIP